MTPGHRNSKQLCASKSSVATQMSRIRGIIFFDAVVAVSEAEKETTILSKKNQRFVWQCYYGWLGIGTYHSLWFCHALQISWRIIWESLERCERAWQRENRDQTVPVLWTRTLVAGRWKVFEVFQVSIGEGRRKRLYVTGLHQCTDYGLRLRFSPFHDSTYRR